MIPRKIESHIFKALENNKVVVILGARRVGKTTLVKSLANILPKARYINCELWQNKEILESTNSEILFSFFKQYDTLIFDEAQSISSIGKTLKIIHDTYPKINLIATGSSAFYLQHQTGEPLTGRSRFFSMSPLSFQEISEYESLLSAHSKLENLMLFGTYPEIYGKDRDYAIEELENIVSNYLLKDILQFENLKKPEVLVNLLRALALQVGNEVSLNELSNKIGVHINTIKRYIELLELNFIIFRLPPLTKNPRNEIGKNQKIYFYDCGIRNAIIKNFNPINLRSDVGQLWENFFISEKRKYNFNNRKFLNAYFWRNYQKKEIDYIEEISDELHLYECKYAEKKRIKIPADFELHYSKYHFLVINKDNYFQFLC